MKAMDTSPHTFSPAWKVKLEPGTEKEEAWSPARPSPHSSAWSPVRVKREESEASSNCFSDAIQSQPSSLPRRDEDVLWGGPDLLEFSCPDTPTQVAYSYVLAELKRLFARQRMPVELDESDAEEGGEREDGPALPSSQSGMEGFPKEPSIVTFSDGSMDMSVNQELGTSPMGLDYQQQMEWVEGVETGPVTMLVVLEEHQAAVYSILHRLQVINEVLSTRQHFVSHHSPFSDDRYGYDGAPVAVEEQSTAEEAPPTPPIHDLHGKQKSCYRRLLTWQPERQPWEEFVEQEWDGEQASIKELALRWRYHFEYIPPPAGGETEMGKIKRIQKMVNPLLLPAWRPTVEEADRGTSTEGGRGQQVSGRMLIGDG